MREMLADGLDEMFMQVIDLFRLSEESKVSDGSLFTDVLNKIKFCMLRKRGKIMFGFLDNLFDFNHDGKLDTGERAMQMYFMHEMFEPQNKQDDLDGEVTDLELAGIDPEELEFMDEDERRELLEEAGLNPDEYDF